MKDQTIELSRRKVLASLGAVGASGATAGLGTSAIFNDSEQFEDGTVTAGNLNLRVDWQEHYYNGLNGLAEFTRPVDSSEDVGDGEVGLPDPNDPMVAVAAEDVPAFMEETTLEESGPVDDPEPGLVEISDVKPGDFGEVTLSYHLSDNPGYVALCAEEVVNEENGLTEPETSLSDDSPAGELGDHLQAVVWYDPNCNNLRDSGDADVVAQGTMNEVLNALGADGSECVRLDPAQSGGVVDPTYGGDCHTPWGGGAGACEETLYLTDSGGDNGFTFTGTRLFEVNLDDDAGQANLNLQEEINDSIYDQVDAIAATPDGTTVYLIDKNTGHLGAYDVSGDSFSDLGELDGTNVSGWPGGTVMAAYSPAGTLYMASSSTDGLYTVDTSQVEFTRVTTIQESLRGTDIAFSADGTLFLISTLDNDGRALYTVDPSDGSVDKLGSGTGELFTGLGIRAAGTGNLVGSATSDDSIYIIGRDGVLGSQYEMHEGGDRYNYGFGDMTVGELCTDRPSGHCVALAWWLPYDVGSIVQSDSIEFEIGFYAEQCRNNDNPPGEEA